MNSKPDRIFYSEGSDSDEKSGIFWYQRQEGQDIEYIRADLVMKEDKRRRHMKRRRERRDEFSGRRCSIKTERRKSLDGRRLGTFDRRKKNERT